jgi:myo-inositol-1(or 4)-monophosphatase
MLSESLLRNHILKDYSDHWILSEEDNGTLNSYEALQKKGSGIDGTTNFIHGIPHFAVSIGIVRDQEPFIAVVYNPLTDELFHARKHFGAFRNDEPIQAGKEKRLGESLLAAGFQAEEWGPNSHLLKQMDKLAGNCRNLRMNGAASLDLCWVAMGRLTGFWHSGLHPWDTAAGVLIVREAGGQVTDNHGNPYQLNHDTLVASNGKIHSEFLSGIEL